MKIKNTALFILSLVALCSYAQDDAREAKRKAARQATQRSAQENEARIRRTINSYIAKGIESSSVDGNKYVASPKFNMACPAPLVLTGKEISNIPPQGIIISSSGSYSFTRDIIWEGTACAAITIAASDVTLNLNGKSLVLKKEDTQKTIGVQIKPSYNKITVKNGIISGPNYYGVSAAGVTDLNITAISVKSMESYDVDTKDFTPCGFFIEGSNNLNLTKCITDGANVTTASYAGIQIVNSKNGSISDCAVSNILNNDGGAQGFSYLSSSGIKTFNCSATNLQTYYKGMTDTTGHTSIGFVPIFCTNLQYYGCRATDIKGCCDDSHGMSVFMDSNVIVTNFTAKNIQDGNYLTGAKATGLEVYGLDITIKNCTVDGIISYVPQDLQCTGFSACGAGIKFDNCVAKNVIVANSQGQPDTNKGYGTGFGWAPDPRYPFRSIPAFDITYTNCTAIDCQLGYDTWYHQSSTWQNNTAVGCAKPILFEPESQRTLSMDKCSESPGGDPFWVKLTNKTDLHAVPSIVVK
jgi:hypothetical protein